MLENCRFVGFEKKNGQTVARFEWSTAERLIYREESFVLDHRNCEARLRNLRNYGQPLEETERAMNRWPVEIGVASEPRSCFAGLN